MIDGREKRRRIPRSTWLPLVLMVYLAGMAYVGRAHFVSGDYLYYFGVIVPTLLVIVVLHFVLKKREAYARRREQDQDSTPDDTNR